MSIITDEKGRQNIFAKEPTMYYEDTGDLTPNQVRELANSRWAMCGIVAGLISYIFTGKLFFGVF